MLEEIIAGLILGGVLGVILLIILFRYRKPIKKYANLLDKALDNLNEDFKKERNERIVGEMRKFVTNSNKNMAMSQIMTRQALLQIDFTGKYPDNLSELWLDVKKKERNENILEVMKKFVANVDEENMTRAQLETKKLIQKLNEREPIQNVFQSDFLILCITNLSELTLLFE